MRYIRVFLLYTYVLFQVIWIVGFFHDSKEYSVIPCNWLYKPIGCKTEKSFTKWPPYAVTSKHLQEAIDSLDDWESYKITILNNGKTYGKNIIFKVF